MSSGRGGSAPSPSFALHAARPRVLLIGEDAGIGPVISLAERLRGELASADYGRGSPPAAGSTSAGPRWKPLVLLGSEQPFPFRARPSAVIVAGIPREVIGCMPLLEEWGIPCRLASRSDFPGCFEGAVPELAAAWLGSLGPAELAEVEMFACGPAAMLEATAALAGRYAIPCQTSLAEVVVAR